MLSNGQTTASVNDKRDRGGLLRGAGRAGNGDVKSARRSATASTPSATTSTISPSTTGDIEHNKKSEKNERNSRSSQAPTRVSAEASGSQ